MSALPHSAQHPVHEAGPCRNCGADIPAEPPAHYCPHCGQETALHPPSVAEFVHEFIGHYVALEGALWTTLGLLVLKPGRLTREYFDGRRRRYVLPLRLYLSASFLFFLAVKLLPALDPFEGGPPGVTDGPGISAGDHAQASRAAGEGFGVFRFDDSEDDGDGAAAPGGSASAPQRARRECAASDAGCGFVERHVSRIGARWREHPQEAAGRFKARVMSTAPYAVFLMLPVFAAIVMLCYRSRRMLYGEHVVFSLHMHSFWFLALLAIALLPSSIDDMLVLVFPVYGVWALRSVYGGRWLPTLARAGVVSVLYGAALLAGTVGLALGALWLA